MAKTLLLKSYKNGEWILNSAANDMISAYPGNVYEIDAEKLKKYIDATGADTIRIFSTFDEANNTDTLVVKCMKTLTERFFDDNGDGIADMVLEHVNPINMLLSVDGNKITTIE